MKHKAKAQRLTEDLLNLINSTYNGLNHNHLSAIEVAEKLRFMKQKTVELDELIARELNV
jgi:hypothetical protein